MELENIRKIEDVWDVGQANKFLELGWRVVNIYTTTGGSDSYIQQTTHYVLAWFGEKEPKYPPDPFAKYAYDNTIE